MIEEKWYVITTKPRTEKQVGLRLTQNEIKNFVPLQRLLRQWKDRKKWVEIPIFSSYVFVQTTEKKRQEVFKIDGIVKYMFIGGKIATLRTDEIERIEKLCNYEQEIKIEERNFVKGDEVEIINGQLLGLKGRLNSSEKGHFLSILIDGLNCFANVKVEKENVRKVCEVLEK